MNIPEKIAQAVDRADWAITNPPGPVSDKINDGGPAFPLRCEWPPERSIGDVQHYPGMSLRDYFAAHVEIKQWELEKFMLREPTELLLCEWESALRYIKADAMLKAREQKP